LRLFDEEARMKALNRTPEQLASLRTKLQPFLGRIAPTNRLYVKE
jgi:hypothetical protein